MPKWIPFGAPQQQPGDAKLEPVIPVISPADAKKFGFENFGNTCYANSVLQALYFCGPFRELVIQAEDNSVPLAPLPPPATPALLPTPVRRKPERKFSSTAKEKAEEAKADASPQFNIPPIPSAPPTLFSALRSLFLHISTHPGDKGTVAPKAFIEKLKDVNELFRSTMHQDAHEFLNFLLNKIVEEIEEERKNSTSSADDLSNSIATLASKSIANAGTSPQNATLVHNLFEGVLTSETRCLTCESVSSRDESFLDLSIDIEQNSSVTACLRQFSASEMLCQGNKFFCDACCDLQEAEKRMKIKKLPNILALHLKRFKYQEDVGKYIKLAYRVAFPFELRLFNTVDDTDEADRLYELFSIVVHIGNGPHHGHYISLIKSQGTWLVFDDDSVDTIKESDIPKYFGDNNAGSAYVLYYQAVDMDLPSLGLRPPSQSASKSASFSTPVDPRASPLTQTPILPPGLIPGEDGDSEISDPSFPATPSISSQPFLPISDKEGLKLSIDDGSVPPSPQVVTPSGIGAMFSSLRRGPSTKVRGVSRDRKPLLGSEMAQARASATLSIDSPLVPPLPPMPSPKDSKARDKEREKEAEKDKKPDKDKKPERKTSTWFKRKSKARDNDLGTESLPSGVGNGTMGESEEESLEPQPSPTIPNIPILAAAVTARGPRDMNATVKPRRPSVTTSAFEPPTALATPHPPYVPRSRSASGPMPEASNRYSEPPPVASTSQIVSPSHRPHSTLPPAAFTSTPPSALSLTRPAKPLPPPPVEISPPSPPAPSRPARSMMRSLEPSTPVSIPALSSSPTAYTPISNGRPPTAPSPFLERRVSNGNRLDRPATADEGSPLTNGKGKDHAFTLNRGRTVDLPSHANVEDSFSTYSRGKAMVGPLDAPMPSPHISSPHDFPSPAGLSHSISVGANDKNGKRTSRKLSLNAPMLGFGRKEKDKEKERDKEKEKAEREKEKEREKRRKERDRAHMKAAEKQQNGAAAPPSFGAFSMTARM